MQWKRGKFAAVVIIVEVVFVVLFGIFVKYDTAADAGHAIHSRDVDRGGQHANINQIESYYPMFQDVHVMIFVGFGFLMTFLKRYGYSSVALNFLIAAICIQWSMLITGFLHLHDGKILINITNMITADFAAATVLISFGAVLGKTSPLQLLFMAIIEIPIFSLNEYIAVYYYKIVDVGGSMVVHTFGAYFGLAVARVIYHKDVEKSQKEGAVYHSDLFSMIGTIFLWMFWPSFNAALADGDERHRAILNTYIALTSCCILAFATSSIVNKDKFDMVHIQNATLAGGVAVGTSADLMITPLGAMIIGSLAGILSVVGYKFLTPCLAKKIHLHDTCGVNNLHGMPGIMAGIIGVIVSSLATKEQYGNSLYQIFAARAPTKNSTELIEVLKTLSIDAGDGRTASYQAVMQLATLGTTLVLAIIGGALTGFLLTISIYNAPKSIDDFFEDEPNWELPEVEECQEILSLMPQQTLVKNKYAESTNIELNNENPDTASAGVHNIGMTDVSEPDSLDHKF